MRRIFTALALAAALVLLAGCGSTPGVKALDTGAGQVRLVELEDGTRCAIYSAPYKGGLDCDWSR